MANDTKKVIVNNRSITLTSKDYKFAGGEAAIYYKGGVAYRIYHEPSKMIPIDKIKELIAVTAKNVIKPLEIIYDASSKDAIGFTMPYLDDVEPLVRFFTATFKTSHSISPAITNELVKNLQSTVSDVHRDRCLIVDLNEMNVLVDMKDKTTSSIIDVGSWQTPSFPATAIMESIRDPQIKNNKFTELSDWYSFGILAVQLYIGIHPYKGSHPNYKPAQWRKRMDDGVSIFDPKASIPSVCLPLSVIPKRHLDWLQAVFGKDERSVPPIPDSTAPVAVPPQVVTIQSNAGFTVHEWYNHSSDVICFYSFTGNDYVVSKKGVYHLNEAKPFYTEAYGNSRILLCPSEDPTNPVVVSLLGTNLRFTDRYQNVIENRTAQGAFVRNNVTYSTLAGNLFEHKFVKLNNKLVARTRAVQNISELSSKVYDGVVVQDLLGTIWLTIPFKSGACITKQVNELKGYRVIEAKAEANVCIIVAERGGQYDRFVLMFNDDFSRYNIRLHADVNYNGINFTVTSAGVVVLMTDDDEIQIFRDVNSAKVIPNPPFNAGMKLFTHNGTNFINGNSLVRVSLK